MKYTVEGFNQEKLVSLGLDIIDAMILRWFVDFQPRMTKITTNGADYYMVKYQAVIDDLPCLGITSKEAISRRFKKIAETGIIEKHEIKEHGTTITYRLTPIYTDLVSRPDDAKVKGATLKSIPDDAKVVYQTTQKSSHIEYNSSINNSSINKEKIYKKENDEIRIEFIEKPSYLSDTNWTQFKTWWNLRLKNHKKLRSTQAALDKQLSIIKDLDNKTIANALKVTISGDANAVCYQNIIIPKNTIPIGKSNPHVFDDQDYDNAQKHFRVPINQPPKMRNR